MTIRSCIKKSTHVFFDTAPLIYFIEAHPVYGEMVRQFVHAFEPISEIIAETAARLRGRYLFLKMADALQVAAALIVGADLFLTNDKQLKQLTEIPVAVLDDYRH